MPKKLKKLDPKHHIAVRLKVEGKTNEQIAKEIGCRKSTVNGWFTDELMKDAVEDLQSRIGEVFAEKMASAGLQTLDVMKQMLEMPISGRLDPETGETTERTYLSFEERLAIIDRFLDRNPHTSKANGAAEGEQPALPSNIQATLNMFSNMNPTELIESLQKIVGGGGGVQLPQIESKTAPAKKS